MVNISCVIAATWKKQGAMVSLDVFIKQNKYKILTVFFLIISAAGLYYIAELVEEYTVISKKIIWWMTVVSNYK